MVFEVLVGVLAPVREQFFAGVLVRVVLTEPVLPLVGFVQTVKVWFAMFSVDASNFDVARVGVVGLEVDADPPLFGVC